MIPRSFAPLLLLLFLPAGCEDSAEVVDVDLTVDSFRQTDREVEIEATVRNRGTVPVRFTSCPGFRSDPSITIVDEEGTKFVLDHSCIAIGAPCGRETLLPGEQSSGTFRFRGSAWDPDTQDPNCAPVCLPFGSYSAVFRFSYSVEGGPGQGIEKIVPFDWPVGPVDLPPAGTWAGSGIELVLEECGGTFFLDCGEGRLSRPLILDEEGGFEGTGALANGPVVRVYEEMFYQGTVDSGNMSLTIYVTMEDGGAAAFGSYELTFGEESDLRPCQ